MITRAICITALVLTTGCGALGKDGLGASALNRLGTLTGLKKAPPKAPPPVPTEALAKGPGHVLMVTLIGRNAVAPLTRVARNGDTDTWRTAKGVTLSLKGDLLVASRGLNEDLMGADIDGVREVIGSGEGVAKRIHSYLDSEDQIRTRDLTCIITTAGPEEITTLAGKVETVKVLENCTSTALVFKNTYWLDEIGGNIVQSRQALAPTVGYIQVNPL